MIFLKNTKNKTAYEEVTFFNLENKYISNFYNEFVKAVTNCFLVITAVDGSVDDYLKKVLISWDAQFEFINEICLLYPESSDKFIAYIKDIPECEFYCCNEKPKEALVKEFKSGYFEYFGAISNKPDILKSKYHAMKKLNSFLYVSQGDCNLFIGLK